MKIYSYLKKDHKTVQKLFEQIISSKSLKKNDTLFKELGSEIRLHAQSEHETFYRALKDHPEGKEISQHGDKEHAEITKILNSLNKLSVNSVEWWVKFGALKYLVEHHVKEEESEMFSIAKKILSDETAEALTQQMEEKKQKLLRQGKF